MSEKTMRVQDYPLATRCPEHILSAFGKPDDRHHPREGALWRGGPAGCADLGKP